MNTLKTHFSAAFRMALCALAMLGLASTLTSVGALAAISGQITGTILDGDTHKPLAGVKVVASSPSGTYTAMTSDGGTFSIIGVVPDTYKISFELSRYDGDVQEGIVVQPDAPAVVNTSLKRTLATIAKTLTKTRPRVNRDTEDSYSVSASTIEQLQGKADDTDEKSLLQKLPSITLDKTGTVFIRGGDPFQVGYQLDGVDTTVANRTLQNREENVGNFDLLNGIGGAQLIPGGGDASHGDSGTGLVSLAAKRGTYPGFADVDLEAVTFPYDHQLTAEIGGATPSGRFSYYLSFTGVREDYQYGQPGTPGANLGIYTDATSLTSINGANAVGIISTAADQQSNDLLGNFFYKFGKSNAQYLQFLFQNQIVRQGESYNGIGNLCYASCSPTGAYLFGNTAYGAPLTGADTNLQALVPLYPGQTTFNQFVGSEDAIYSPFELYKLEYGNNLNSSTYFVGRLFQTSSDQIEDRASIGIYNPQNGGTRTGFSTELDKQLGKHFLQVGGQYEFVSPYGTLEDVTDYEYGYFGVAGNVSPNAAAPTSAQCVVAGGCLPTAPVVYDFLPATSPECSSPTNNGGPAGTYKFQGGAINIPSQSFTETVPCGYLSKYFPNGIPTLPPEIESPETKQQVYGYYLQDRFTLGAKATVQAGLRLDGYNFIFPDDPANPESISTVAHQRLFEPHLGITRLLTPRDSIRATYGRTLSIPLPGLSGNTIERSTFDAFNNVPSYNNLTGAPATYCGLNLNTTCTSYADQLFWIMRDARFPTSDVAPLRGSTFTNYDFTYSHTFPSGLAFNVTPFFRRGYDIVEQSNTLTFTTGLNPEPILRPAVESNLGIQKSTGIEASFDYTRDPGFSFRASGTYLNQLGNDPPLNYLSTASLDLGTLYRSQLFSPFQGTLAMTYHTGIIRINPVFTYALGYPYGVGNLVQVFLPNGKPANVPNTNLATGSAGNTPECYVDPEYSGTLTNPNISACTGSPELSSAGGLLSKADVNLDLTITFHAPSSRNTFGLKFTNVFNQLYGYPVPNPYFSNLIATGVYGPGSGYRPVSTTPNTTVSGASNGAPANFPAYDYGSYPYLLFPNRPPFETRVFYQVQL
jgi:hypothetical protein